jgi:molybdenum cofactor synthesis domain-containing protein
MTETSPVTACLIVIGNEILSGRTQDANVAFFAKKLNESGIRLAEVRVIPDIAETIVATVNAVRPLFDYVFTTGGIGPTHDDITAENVARAFGVGLVLSEEARDRLDRLYRARGVELNAARLRMAHVPEGAVLIDNPISAAPGFQIGNVLVMAGVPVVAQAMFEAVRPRLRGGRVTLSRTVACALSEGQIARALGEIQAAYKEIDIGSYPSWGEHGPVVSIVSRGTDAAMLDRAVAEIQTMIRSYGGVPQPG